MFEFYGYFRSSAAYRCRIAFNLKNIDYKFIPIHLKKDGGQQFSPEYKKINPQSLVPSLKENDFSLSQSLAIIEWLEEKYPEPNLLPEDINMRAKARAFCLTIACEIHPFQNLRVQEFIREEFNQNDEKIEKWLTRWMAGGLTECDEILSNLNSQYKFCFGNKPSIADIFLVPQIFSANRFNIDISKLSNLKKVFENCSQLEAFKNAHPSNQPDSE